MTQDEIIEEWKEIEGYGDLYFISNLGRVMSDVRGDKRIMKPGTTNKYLSVTLSGVVIKTFRVHRLVALAFIPNPENKPFINHKNGQKFDNRVENLEWCTMMENVKHSFETGLSKIGEQHPCAKLNENQVREIRKSELGCTALGRIYNVKECTIRDAKLRRTWKKVI